MDRALAAARLRFVERRGTRALPLPATHHVAAVQRLELPVGENAMAVDHQAVRQSLLGVIQDAAG
jgi:hypothetical protein